MHWRRVVEVARRQWARVFEKPAALALAEPAAEEFDAEIAARRAARAEAALAHPLIAEAFDTLERGYIAAWMATRADQTAERERLWDAISIVRTVQAHLRSVANGRPLLERQVFGLLRRSATALKEMT
jgi:hypothetical protein